MIKEVVKLVRLLIKPITVLLIISLVFVFSYPYLLTIPAKKDIYYYLGICINSIALSYISGYVFYSVTVILPFHKRRKDAYKHLKILSNSLYSQLIVINKPLFSIIECIDGNVTEESIITKEALNRIIEIFGDIKNHGNIPDRLIHEFMSTYKNFMPQIYYILDQMIELKEFLPDSVYKEVLFLKTPGYNVFLELSTNFPSIAGLLSFWQHFIIGFNEKITTIHMRLSDL